MPRGGKRAGAGLPKGYKFKRTLEKEQAREVLRQHLTERLDTVATALLSRAQGVRYFVTRNKKTGKYELVTNPDQVIAALNAEDENTGEFYTDKPDVSAIREILDRALDKAKEQEQTIEVKGDAALVAALTAARARIARAGSET